MIHLVTHHEDQGPSAWCPAAYDSITWRDTDNPAEATCEACLLAAFEYGIRAMRQRLFLKDGRILDKHQAIEKILDDLARPVVYLQSPKDAP